jgi:uncharacterized protein YecE (DUF72 family)
VSKNIRIGTAGWAVPRLSGDQFPTAGSGLERYAARFFATEVNSTFRRSHMAKTWERWAASVPDDFRFAVKFPKVISHELRMVTVDEHVSRFWEEVRTIKQKLGPLLLQLPPSLVFEPAIVRPFFETLTLRVPHAVVCEPRHPSWFGDEADSLMSSFSIARVAADPARVQAAATPGGFVKIAYYRLHGSPRVYYSAYGTESLEKLAADLSASAAEEVWCIFDNTTLGAATANALELQRRLGLNCPAS